MKRIFILIILIIFSFAVKPVTAYSADIYEMDSEINQQLDDILEDYGIDYSAENLENISLSQMFNIIKEYAVSRISAPFRILAEIFMIVIFTAVMKSFGETVSEKNQIYSMVCVMAAVSVIFPQLMTVYENTFSSLKRGGGFLVIFVPVFTAVSVAGGGITSAGVYNIMILAASEIIIELSRNFLLPLIGISAALSVTGSIFPNNSLDSVVQLIKKITVWAITVCMTFFTGFVTLKCTIAGKADSFASKTAKFVLSGAVPIVGGAVSDAYSTVRGSFDVIKATVGSIGITAILLVMLPPVIEIMIIRLVMWTGSAAAELFSADSINKLLKSFDSGLAIAQSLLVCYSMMFILCSAILMNTMG